MEVKHIEYNCMNCNAFLSIEESICKDGMSCPGCKGPFKVTGYETTTIYRDGEPYNEPLLLTIELQDETSVPKVIYKGEEIFAKKSVSFDWETDTDYMGGLTYAIEHHEKNNYPVTNTIERRVKGHAMD